MNFADELRKSSVISEDEIWRQMCISAVSEMKSRVEAACRLAARKGLQSTWVSYTFDYYHHKNLYPSYDAKTPLLGAKKEHPRYTILKQVIFDDFIPYISRLGLGYGGITTKRTPDSYYGGYDYTINIGVHW